MTLGRKEDAREGMTQERAWAMDSTDVLLVKTRPRIVHYPVPPKKDESKFNWHDDVKYIWSETLEFLGEQLRVIGVIAFCLMMLALLVLFVRWVWRS